MSEIDIERADLIIPESIDSGERATDAIADDEQATSLPVADEAGLAAAAYYADREPIDGTITVADLTPLSCRWPTGNPRDLKTFRYCGETASWGPYCERHARLAYLPRAA
jgi:hypothetical protein